MSIECEKASIERRIKMIISPNDALPSYGDDMLMDYTKTFTYLFARSIGVRKDDVPFFYNSNDMHIGSGFYSGRWPVPATLIAPAQHSCNLMTSDAHNISIEAPEDVPEESKTYHAAARSIMLNAIHFGYDEDDFAGAIEDSVFGVSDNFCNVAVSHNGERYQAGNAFGFSGKPIQLIEFKNTEQALAYFVGIVPSDLKKAGMGKSLSRALLNGKATWNKDDLIRILAISCMNIVEQISHGLPSLTSEEKIPYNADEIALWSPAATNVAWQLYPIYRRKIEENSTWIYVERDNG